MPHPESAADNQNGLRGTETILLIEDEVEIVELLEKILTLFGYNVISSMDGNVGLEVYRSRSKTIDIVVSDLGLPGRDGLSLLQEALALDPQADFILTSGYLDIEQTEKLLSAGARAVIQKPYVPSALIRLIRTILDQRARL